MLRLRKVDDYLKYNNGEVVDKDAYQNFPMSKKA